MVAGELRDMWLVAWGLCPLLVQPTGYLAVTA